jgi:hypothetical protein
VELEKGGYGRCNIKMVYDYEISGIFENPGCKARLIAKNHWQKFAGISTREWSGKTFDKKME